MKYNFSGYATKNDLKCTDGRTIRKDAFKENNGITVPLVWQHMHNNPDNVLGHALLENRADGVYAFCSFNDSEAGKNAKVIVEHGDIKNLSIYANELKQKGTDVEHGNIKEVSLVLAGANPGALIDNLCIQHGDKYDTVAEEAIIYSGIAISNTEIEHADTPPGSTTPPAGDKTVQEVYDEFTEEQKGVVCSLITSALEDKTSDTQLITHSLIKGGTVIMKKNLFDNKDTTTKEGNTLTHAQFSVILADAQKSGSLKEAILSHAVEYGIENIDVLFPDAQTLSKDPTWLKREDSWVQLILNGISKSPFSRVKSVIADMDIDTARAKGYIKATEKKEVYFKASKRVITPTTVYVKQKLDRDDILDVIDFDIVAMVRFQLRTLLDEELALAALLGDGRAVDDIYKINEENIIPIYSDVDLYTIKEELTTKTDFKSMVKQIALTNKRYKGSGSPVLYTTPDIHTNMLWIEDTTGRRIYESDATLCAALRVSAIVEIPQIEGMTRTIGTENDTRELMAIKVNLRDYNFGADKGGQVATFDDFDIDFNQFKYLMETRCSGGLTKPNSAQVYEFVTVIAG